jgi:MOSC domain-containing protein
MHKLRPMAVVTRISIAPIKGLALVHPDDVHLDRTGVLENRRFYIVDDAGRRYGQIRNGRLVQIRVAYDSKRERLALTFPDGTVAAGVVALADEITTDFYGRPVAGRLLVGPWNEALSNWAGRSLRVVQPAPGEAVDRARGAVSLVSEASLRELARHGNRDDPVDGRRFRMLFQVDSLEAHAEDKWLRRQVRIGEALIRLRGLVGRCAITTQNPDTGVPDFDTLRVLDDYRGMTAKRELPFGVYGEVLEPGRVRVGDLAEPLELSLLDATA